MNTQVKSEQWTPEKYAAYQLAVEHNLKHLTFVSTGACPGCEECGCPHEDCQSELEQASEPHFSWSACESCGSHLGGNRHPAHGRDNDNSIVHFSVCEDCLYFLNYGHLDDTTMMEIKANEPTTH